MKRFKKVEALKNFGIIAKDVVVDYDDVKAKAITRRLTEERRPIVNADNEGNYKSFSREEAKAVLTAYLNGKIEEKGLSLRFGFDKKQYEFNDATPLKELKDKLSSAYGWKALYQFILNVKQKYDDLGLGEFRVQVYHAYHHSGDRDVFVRNSEMKVVVFSGIKHGSFTSEDWVNNWIAEAEHNEDGLVKKIEEEIKKREEKVELSERFWKYYK